MSVRRSVGNIYCFGASLSQHKWLKTYSGIFPLSFFNPQPIYFVICTLQEDLQEYFNTFGNVVDCQVLMDEETGKNRGFAFVLFDDFDSGSTPELELIQLFVLND